MNSDLKDRLSQLNEAVDALRPHILARAGEHLRQKLADPDRLPVPYEEEEVTYVVWRTGNLDFRVICDQHNFMLLALEVYSLKQGFEGLATPTDQTIELMNPLTPDPAQIPLAFAE